MSHGAQFRDHVIDPTLKAAAMYSRAASNLLLGTALSESGLRAFYQEPAGPAVSYYQIEPATARWLIVDYLGRRTDLAARAKQAIYTVANGDVDWNAANMDAIAERLKTDLRLATLVARLRYWVVPEKLPAAHDVRGLADYYFQHYATPGSKANRARFRRAITPFI